MSKKNLEFISCDFSPLPDNCPAKAVFLKDMIKVVTWQKSLKGIKRISKTQYVNVETGEICQYKINNQKADNTQSMKNSLNKLNVLIQNNFEEFKSFFVTLTYAEEMQAFYKAGNDFRKFYDKLKYHYNQNRLEYLRIIEATENGTWHIHILLKSSIANEKFIIKQEDVQALWKYGSVKVSRIYNVNGLIKYFCTHHSEKSMKNIKKSKSKIKQARWKYYPYGARIYSKSKGIVYPREERGTRIEIDKYVVGHTKIKEDSAIAQADTGSVFQRITHEYFDNK